MDQIAHFWPEWWFKLFTSAYRGSPPPAVFQNKYQSYKYERNTAGKSASNSGETGDLGESGDSGESGGSVQL